MGWSFNSNGSCDSCKCSAPPVTYQCSPVTLAASPVTISFYYVDPLNGLTLGPVSGVLAYAPTPGSPSRWISPYYAIPNSGGNPDILPPCAYWQAFLECRFGFAQMQVFWTNGPGDGTNCDQFNGALEQQLVSTSPPAVSISSVPGGTPGNPRRNRITTGVYTQ
jgi:hypothetical protein